jgi:hypothetical protein
MRSPLDFGNSDRYRKELTLRNLTPYKKSPFGNTPPFYYEVSPLNVFNVKDSPDNLIDTAVYANQAYTRNQFGTIGGYKIVTDIFKLRNTKTNNGEYNYSKASTLKNNLQDLSNNVAKNFYSGVDVKYNVYSDAKYYIEKDDYWFDPNLPKRGIMYYYVNGNPSFTPSEYTAFELFTKNANTKSKLSADSYIVRLGSEKLNEYFEDRVGRFVSKYNILTRFENAISDINDPLDVYNLITGVKPIIEPIWTITRTNNFIFGAAQLGMELAGAELPFPTIVGSYFDPTISLTGKPKKGFLGGLFQQKKTGSQLFFENTGKGQKSILFANIEFNLYRPNYRGDGVIGGVIDLFTKDKNGYYVGSSKLDITDVTGPQKDLPEDQFGRRVQTPVYGASEVSKLYEGEDFAPKIGANGQAFTDGGGIEGGLTWVSPKYKTNAGKDVGLNGQVFGDSNTKQATYGLTESTEFELKPGSIMDDTQKLVDSQPNGGNRLKHVGNAIDQVSKVFNDGYKEITKGSKVRKYSPNLNGGTFEEYCRLFTKDTPFLTYSRLQKKDGIVSEGRRLKSSVFNKTYDLSIYPKKGNDSKKYMLSIENLAWRTSDLFLNLPECEKGPNGGRIMWFPPYDLKFSDSSTSNWNENDFLGRPEKVHTYKNTSRTGTLEFSIVVDHPSVLNVITNRILENQSNSERVNGILESFFSGCLTYDLYELAKIYNTMTLSELEEIQKQVQESYTVKDEVDILNRTYITGKDPSTENETNEPIIEDKSKEFDEFKSLSFYFDNDIPLVGNTSIYVNLYNTYTNKKTYDKSDLKDFMNLYVKNNFNGIDKFIEKANKFLEDENAEITIDLVGSASRPQTFEYNDALGTRRTDNAQKYIRSKITYNNRLKFKSQSKGERDGVTAKTYTPIGVNGNSFEVSTCSGFTQDKIYSQQAMACRRTLISNIKATISTKPKKKEPAVPTNSDVIIKRQTKEKNLTEITNKLYRNVSKKVLQKLLSECDYFATIEETDPFVYNNLKEKLKYFSPVFHSTTPEGLNGRLTFLQQCLRPGNTIPTIKKDGTKDYKDAKNTTFGIPPVLVLRVGDFFHTKIIPGTLGLTYEHLDLNPEGIGLQPMIAKVNLSFTFVGAHGLDTAIDKLQNALNFNYYANTEVYDARADVTDESLNDTDQKILDYIKEKEKVEIENNTAQQTTNTYTTIGEIDEENNILKYGNIVDMTNKDTIGYITTITSIIEQNLIRFNSSFIGYVLSTVNNSVGVYLTTKDDNFALLGIPTSYQSNLTSIFNQIVKAIENGSDGFASKIKTTFKTQKDVQLEVTNNYISYLKSEFDKIIIDVNSFVNSIIKAQENYQRNVAKLLFVTSTYNNSEGYDGYQDKEGNISIYKLTTTTDNVRKILGSAKTNIGEVIDVINKKVDPYNLLPNIQESLIYFLFYGILKNKDNLTDFENKILIKSVSSNNLTTNSEIRTMFKEYWGSLINVEFALGIELTGEDLYKSTLIAKSKSSVDNLKGITITPSKYDFSYSIVENPDNNMKEALFNLNSKLDYDITNNKTWNQNKDNFILVKNKLSK